MISRMGILQKRDDMTREQFVRHWRDVHAPIVAKMDCIREYYQYAVTNAQQLGIGFAARSGLDIDGVSELIFDDYHDMQKGMQSQAGDAQADLPLFQKPGPVIVCFKHEVVSKPIDYRQKPYVKRMTFLQRKPELTAEQFQYEWVVLHAEMVKSHPHVLGYSQDIIIDRLKNGVSVPYSEFPYDGIVEFWFESVEKLEASFASPEYAHTSSHGKSFLATMTTFLMDVTKIVP